MKEPEKRFQAVDVGALPRHFDAAAVEAKWAAAWEESGIYGYDSSRSREDTFVVDTPPPPPFLALCT